MSIPYPMLFVGLFAAGLATFLFFPEDGLSKLQKRTSEQGTVLFVGDIMLGRSVERRMESEGLQYPFEAVEEFLFEPDVTVGNFESAIPETHVPTPNFSFAFSVPAHYMGILKEEGFDVLSLANNHALDYGQDGFKNTLQVCSESEVECFGHPTQISDESTTIITASGTRIGLIGIHTLFNAPDKELIATLLGELSEASDMQIAYVHWGEEYEPFHNAAQESLAEALIDAGADAVVGHHPHVVQDIGIYEGKPIFYSLGNFIFDQYWSLETQEGLAVKLRIDKEAVHYELIPITSIDTKSQPHLVPPIAAEKTVEALVERSTGVADYFEDGALVIPR